jgi:hypothetical protein
VQAGRRDRCLHRRSRAPDRDARHRRRPSDLLSPPV